MPSTFPATISSYSALATSRTPALIIYLLDLSKSMGQSSGTARKIDLVTKALSQSIVSMIRRSTKGNIVADRYRLAIFGYHSKLIDILRGIKKISEISNFPSFPALDYGAQTAYAFECVEKILQKEMANLSNCPAPLICHPTDGINAGADPEPVVTRIKQMNVEDGPVLVENIFVSQSVLKEPISDVGKWPGIKEHEQIQNDKKYARRLFNMSSIIPNSYLDTIGDFGYNLQSGARMLFPGDQPEIIKLGFAMSGATPVSK